MSTIVSVTSKLRRDRARRLRGDQTASEARLWDRLRFWNSEVSEDFDGVCCAILRACRETDPRLRGHRVARRP